MIRKLTGDLWRCQRQHTMSHLSICSKELAHQYRYRLYRNQPGKSTVGCYNRSQYHMRTTGFQAPTDNASDIHRYDWPLIWFYRTKGCRETVRRREQGEWEFELGRVMAKADEPVVDQCILRGTNPCRWWLLMKKSVIVDGKSISKLFSYCGIWMEVRATSCAAKTMIIVDSSIIKAGQSENQYATFI